MDIIETIRKQPCVKSKGDALNLLSAHMNNKAFQMEFGKVYELLLDKATRKGRAKTEVVDGTPVILGYSAPPASWSGQFSLQTAPILRHSERACDIRTKSSVG